MPNLVTHLNWTPIFECYVARSRSKNGHPKHVFLKDCTAHVFKINSIILDSITTQCLEKLMWSINEKENIHFANEYNIPLSPKTYERGWLQAQISYKFANLLVYPTRSRHRAKSVLSRPTYLRWMTKTSCSKSSNLWACAPISFEVLSTHWTLFWRCQNLGHDTDTMNMCINNCVNCLKANWWVS